jgi:uncharacterized protein (DUF427 family)
MADRGRVRVEKSDKRVRAYLGGELVFDTTKSLLVWEVPYYPTYYIPRADIRTELLVDTGDTRRSPSRGDATQFAVKAGNSEGAAYTFLAPKIDEITDHYAFVWKTMDHWFEEDEEVFVHARDPYTRIDVLPSSRRVRVEVGGVTVADSTNVSFLFETGLPTRYYFPKTDVRLDLLTPTDLETACPYQGTARYWSLTVDGDVYENVIWGYDSPLPESYGIGGLISFYSEKVDIYVDGELQERPKTKFS